MARSDRESMDVMVTGSSGGVGSRVVRRLDAMGHRVFAGVRRAADADQLGARVVPVVFDITDDAGVLAAAEQVRATVGGAGLHGLVNCAGMIVQGPLELVSTAAMHQQFDVNVVGPLAAIRAVLPDLRRGSGRIVNVGAATGRTAVPLFGPISASKSALASLTDALRMELRLQGIDVCLVEPGAMETPIFDKADRFANGDLQRFPAATRAVYGAAMAAAEESLGGARRSSPDLAVDAVVKALTERHPSARYLVGRDARGLSSLRWLPPRSRDRILMRTVGLRPAVFAERGGDDAGAMSA